MLAMTMMVGADDGHSESDHVGHLNILLLLVIIAIRIVIIVITIIILVGMSSELGAATALKQILLKELRTQCILHTWSFWVMMQFELDFESSKP